MIFRTIALALLLASSNAVLLRGNDQQTEKGEKRKLASNKSDNLCNAAWISSQLAMFGITGQQNTDLTAAALTNCQTEDAIRSEECICPNDAVRNYCPIMMGTGGNRRMSELERGLAVVESDCTSNSMCGSPQKCLVANQICVCDSQANRPGAIPMCEPSDAQCGGGGTVPP